MPSHALVCLGLLQTPTTLCASLQSPWQQIYSTDAPRGAQGPCLSPATTQKSLCCLRAFLQQILSHPSLQQGPCLGIQASKSSTPTSAGGQIPQNTTRLPSLRVPHLPPDPLRLVSAVRDKGVGKQQPGRPSAPAAGTRVRCRGSFSPFRRRAARSRAGAEAPRRRQDTLLGPAALLPTSTAPLPGHSPLRQQGRPLHGRSCRFTVPRTLGRPEQPSPRCKRLSSHNPQTGASSFAPEPSSHSAERLLPLRLYSHAGVSEQRVQLPACLPRPGPRGTGSAAHGPGVQGPRSRHRPGQSSAPSRARSLLPQGCTGRAAAVQDARPQLPPAPAALTARSAAPPPPVSLAGPGPHFRLYPFRFRTRPPLPLPARRSLAAAAVN